MRPDELKQVLDRASDAIEQHMGLPRPDELDLVPFDPGPLLRSAERLSHHVYVLLPPRGPTQTTDCPHCGNPVKVHLSR